MILRTCLLISDDPDDQAEFTEALQVVSGNTVVLVVSDAEKAIALLSVKKHIPDFIIIDLAIDGFSADVFFETLENDAVFNHIPLLAYGQLAPGAGMINKRISVYLGDDFTYTELRNVLEKFVNAL